MTATPLPASEPGDPSDPSEPSRSADVAAPGGPDTGAQPAAPASVGAALPPVSPDRYVRPGGRLDAWSMTAVRWLTEHGVSLLGSRVLTVRGRRTGTPRSVPVNLLVLDGERYLVAPRGTTQWVRNVRAADTAELRVGRRTETVRLVEVPAAERVPVLRAYLARWGWEVGRFVEGLTRRSTDAELASVAPGMPVFHVEPAGS